MSEILFYLTGSVQFILTRHEQRFHAKPAKIAKIAKINAYHTSLLAYYLEKLDATPDGDGSLLDHLILLYGAGMADSNEHDPRNLPLLVVGGGSGRLKSGRHLKFAGDRPMANLLVTLADKLGVPVAAIGNSNGKIEELSLA